MLTREMSMATPVMAGCVARTMRTGWETTMGVAIKAVSTNWAARIPAEANHSRGDYGLVSRGDFLKHKERSKEKLGLASVSEVRAPYSVSKKLDPATVSWTHQKLCG